MSKTSTPRVSRLTFNSQTITNSSQKQISSMKTTENNIKHILDNFRTDILEPMKNDLQMVLSKLSSMEDRIRDFESAVNKINIEQKSSQRKSRVFRMKLLI